MQSLAQSIQHGTVLDREQLGQAVAWLLDEAVTIEQKAEFLIALHTRGETAEEIAAFVEALLAHAVDPALEPGLLPGPMIDICGTGGDKLNLFNISTTSMFVVAAAGAVVVKHGNRSVTSQCGGADVLEELGVRIDLPPTDFKRCVETHGFGFLFAPHYHPAFKSIGPVRKHLASQGRTSIFNLLGPLLNPARPPYQLSGIFDPSRLMKYAQVFQLLGRKCAWAVHGSGADEIVPYGITDGVVATPSSLESFLIDSTRLGVPPATLEDLRGGGRKENAAILLGILADEVTGPKRDAVRLNAAAALVVCGLAPGMASGMELATLQLENGAALGKLRALQQFS
ncbi:MAG: anthranilate phosphoribosyltransferase [Chthoniobacteraceae bacterium]